MNKHIFTTTVGMWAEFILPLLIVIGLFSRLASVGMIGFIIMQTLTDIYGHGMTDAKTLGGWFDASSGSLIMDQRLLWITLLVTIIVKGAGPVSADRLMGRLT